MTLTIKRAATGKEETVELVGRATPEELQKLGLGHLVPQPAQPREDTPCQ